MKTAIKTFIAAIALTFSCAAQNVGINETGTAPDNSALLDLSSTDKGFLITRVDTVNIASPAFGLMTLAPSDSCLYMYSGTKWIGMGGGGKNCSCNCVAPPTGSSCGTQVWATTNLNAGTMVNSTGSGSQQTTNEKYCYNNVAANCAIYGGLYEWNDVMLGAASVSCDPCGSGGVQGMCPLGYHIPTDLEWSRYEYCLDALQNPTDGNSSTNTLAYFQTNGGWRGSTTAGVGPGDKMKVTSSNTPAWNGTNTSGFAALPASYRYVTNGSFVNWGTETRYWSATEDGGSNARMRGLSTSSAQSALGTDMKSNGESVRCLQD